MYICSNNNCWFTNIGEAFIDLGVKAIVHNLAKKDDAIHYACVSPMSNTYLPESASDRAFRNDAFYEPDVLFLAGMYATSEAFINDGSCITYEFAKELRKKGFNTICGIDEAGRGPLAGPVVVASVIMPADSMIEGVNDSKKVSEKKREKLYDQILEEAISYGVGIIGQDEIDEINILNATKKGLTMSLQELTVKPDLIIVDALNHIDTLGIPYESIIKGDAKCYSIAAASIIAKVTRDRIMREWDKVYPQYGFEKHKGYGTAAHIAAIKEYGLCPIHRKSFTTHFV